MAADKSRFTFILVYFLLPLIALSTLGVSSYLWYRAFKPGAISPPVVSTTEKKPETFSEELPEHLTRLLSDFGVEERDIKRKDADQRKDGVRHIYTVKIPEKSSLMLLNLRVTLLVKSLGGSIFRGIEGADGTMLTLTLGASKQPTDIIILRKIPGIELKQAKMAIIIDDVGFRSSDSARRFCNLGQVVTLSILPFQPHTMQDVELARETGTPYMLHMPMEPRSSEAKPGEGVILDDDDKSVILQKLRKAFRSVNGAPGLNNHMGSKVTDNVRAMEFIMAFLAENDLFFVDSKTSLNTAAYATSTRMGVKSAIINSYLDNEDDEAYIENRLEKLATHAFDNGQAIAIGHDRSNTLAVIERKLPELEKRGITFVPVSALIR